MSKTTDIWAEIRDRWAGPRRGRAPALRHLDEPTDDEVADLIRRVPVHHSIVGSGTYPELFFSSSAAATAMTANAVETSLLTGLNNQPILPVGLFSGSPGASARSLLFKAKGILSTTTGPPTLTIKSYLNSTQGLTNFAGTAVGASAAITTVASATSKLWRYELEVVCRAPGQGAGNATLCCIGMVWSPAGFASPFEFTLTPGAGDSATVTATTDGGVPLYYNLSGTWSSASNSCTLHQLEAFAWN